MIFIQISSFGHVSPGISRDSGRHVTESALDWYKVKMLTFEMVAFLASRVYDGESLLVNFGFIWNPPPRRTLQ